MLCSIEQTSSRGTTQWAEPRCGEVCWRDGHQRSYRSFLEENVFNNFCCWAKESLHESMLHHFKVKTWWCNRRSERCLTDSSDMINWPSLSGGQGAAPRCIAQTCGYLGQLLSGSLTQCAWASWWGSQQQADVQMGQPASFLPAARERCISQLSNDCKRAVDLIICTDSNVF